MNQLILRNRQRIKPVRLKLFRLIMLSCLQDDLKISSFDLGIYLVGPRTMAQINHQHLQHEGPTDVITFNYSTAPKPTGPKNRRNSPLHGEIFICVPVAMQQALLFQTSWQSELVRYVIHGLLHLLGYDDINSVDRRVMKKQENRLVRQVISRHSLAELSP
jgi:probable rRNA maturation factor